MKHKVVGLLLGLILLLPRIVNATPGGFSEFRDAIWPKMTPQSLTGNATFTKDDIGNTGVRIFLVDPGGSNRNYDPSGDFTAGTQVIIRNQADASETITFDSGDTAVSITQAESRSFIYNGSSWDELGGTSSLVAGVDYYSVSAADAAFEGELNNSAGLAAALSDETGTGLAVFGTAPTFTTSITMGSAALSEAELEILDGATTTTTQLNYLNAATGTTGTTSTNLVFSTSPILVTPTLGAATATSITIDASATPAWVFRDSGNPGSDKEIAKIYSNYISGADGAEDGESHHQVMDSGSEKTYLQAEGTSGAEFVDLGPPDCTYDVKTYWSVSAVDGQYSGNVITMTVDSGQTQTSFGQIYTMDSDGELINADADVASAAAAPGMCLALETGTGSKKVLLNGIITETDWNWTTGPGKSAIIYLSDDPTTTEGLTQTAPATTGDQVQVVGVALSATTILFEPSLVLVEVP